MSNESPRRLPVFSVITILIAVGWLLAGALYKLFEGSPNDLPPMVKDAAEDMFKLDMVGTFRLAITIEIIVATLALLRPRIGWFFLAVQYLVFLVILGWMQALGAEKCGCFGSNINIQPWEMMVIDGPILVLLLASRPWRIRLKFRPVVWGAVLAISLVAWWAPYQKITTIDDVEIAQGGGDEDEPNGSGADEGTGAGNGTETGEGNTVPVGPTNPLANVGFVELKPNEWAGQIIYDTDLATKFMVGGADDLPFPAHVILYRMSCEHCRDHLNKLSTDSPITDKSVVLVLIPEDESMPKVIEMLPEGHLHKELWPVKRGYGISTPWTFDIDDVATVTNVVHLRDE